MKYKLYYHHEDVRKHLPANIEVYYDFNNKWLNYYTYINEELATYLKLVYPGLPCFRMAYDEADHEKV